MKENKSLRSWRLLALVVISQFLWPSVFVWSAVAQSQRETQQQETHWPTHYVIVIRNTSTEAYSKDYGKQWIPLISRDEVIAAIDSIPRGLAAASEQISLWRKPEPGDLISVVFAAAGKDPKPPAQDGCESPHYPDPSVPSQNAPLKLNEYFHVRARIDVKEHDSPSSIADPSSKLYQKLQQSLDVKDCHLIANAYSEALTLAKSLPFVEIANANREEKYKQFFLLVFDFASPAYGSTNFNREFEVVHEDPAPGTPAYFIASIGSLKFDKGNWAPDLLNYLDYPALEPGGGRIAGDREMSKFYPRLRFYRAVAHEAHSDPFYSLANAQRETERLNFQDAQLNEEIDGLNQKIDQREKKISQLEEDLETTTTTALVVWITAATVALLMVWVTWQWWAIKGRFRRMAEEFREKKAALEAEKEELMTSAVCIPDAPNKEQASAFA